MELRKFIQSPCREMNPTKAREFGRQRNFNITSMAKYIGLRPQTSLYIFGISPEHIISRKTTKQ